MSDLYTVTYVEHERDIFEVHAAGAKNLLALVSLLDDTTKVNVYKVTSSGATLKSEMFGWGYFKKWKQTLFSTTI